MAGKPAFVPSLPDDLCLYAIETASLSSYRVIAFASTAIYNYNDKCMVVNIIFFNESIFKKLF